MSHPVNEIHVNMRDGFTRKVRADPATGRFVLTAEDVYHATDREMEDHVNDDEIRRIQAPMMETRAQAHVKLGFVGQILVRGAIAWESTEPFESSQDAKAAADKRLAEKLAGLFAD